MAEYRERKINANSSAATIWKSVKNAVAVAGCAEVREDPDDPGGLILITWLDEHVNFDEHEKVD